MNSIILASASQIRLQILQNAGLTVKAIPADIDEATLKQENSDKPASDIAGLLAEQKALKISNTHPDQIVIGADQILVFGDRIFDKPDTILQAREDLQILQGQTHRLISAACCALAGKIIWATTDDAQLVMRKFSQNFLDKYLEEIGQDVTRSVGGYKIEGLGLQLFEEINGDHFTILGLPLLSLMAFLRNRDILDK